MGSARRGRGPRPRDDPARGGSRRRHRDGVRRRGRTSRGARVLRPPPPGAARSMDARGGSGLRGSHARRARDPCRDDVSSRTSLGHKLKIQSENCPPDTGLALRRRGPERPEGGGHDARRSEGCGGGDHPPGAHGGRRARPGPAAVGPRGRPARRPAPRASHDPGGRPVRIALFTDTYLPTIDGAVTSILTTRRPLEADGPEGVVFAPDDPGRRMPSDPRTIPLRARAFRSYPGYRLAMFPGHEVDLVKDLDIDVIHSHGVGFVGVKGLWSAWQARIPIVQTFHTMIQDTLPFYSPFGLNLHLLERGLRLYLRIFLRKCQGVVVPSRAILEEILALSPEATIADVIPTGVDPRRFHPYVSGDAVRNRWGLNGQDVVLHVGRVAPEKNLGTLIHAFRRVRDLNGDAKLLVVGSGPYLEKCYDLVRRLGLAGDVIFTGFVPDADLPKYYAAADAFAIASKFETQGLVVLEALASGRPVAGANYRAIPEFVQDGVNGALFEPNDVRGCAEAILRCLKQRDEMRGPARESALPFSIERCTRRLEHVYERLVAG